MSMEFWNASKHIAKKQHKCEMCGGLIKAGEIYQRESGKFYGEFFSRALHKRCANFEAEYCYKVDTEFTWDAIEDCIREEYCRDCCYKDDNNDCEYTIYSCPHLTSEFGKVVEG